MKLTAQVWARRGLALLLSLSMVGGGVPATVYAEALNPPEETIEELTDDSKPEEVVDEQSTNEQLADDELTDEQLKIDDEQEEAADDEEVVEEQFEGALAEEPAPIMPAFCDEVYVEGVVVRVQADEGAFPEGVHLEACRIAGEEEAAAAMAADDALPNNQVVQDSIALDVRIEDESGNEIEPAEGTNVSVSFQAAEIANDATDTSVIHLLDDGTADVLDATVEGDTATAVTDTFSTYLVVFSAPEVVSIPSMAAANEGSGGTRDAVINVTVTPIDMEKTYGDSDPDLTATVDPSSAADEIDFKLTRDEGEDAGTYNITASGETSQCNGKYSVTYAGPGTFTIKTLEVTAKADNQSKTYGECDPNLTFTVEPDPIVGDTLNFTLDRVKGEDAPQNYSIFFVNPVEWQSGHTGSDAPNYHITYEEGKLTIDQRVVKVKANDTVKTYGEPDPEFTATVTGTIKGETVTYSFEREDPGEDVGEYKIQPIADADQGSYKVEVRSGTLTIAAKPVTVTPHAKSKTYGESDPKLTATVEPASAAGEISYELSREEGEDAGSYQITATGAEGQRNYHVIFVNDPPTYLTVNKKKVTVDGITAEDKTYDRTAAATLVTTNATVHDPASNDTLTVKATGKFEDRDAGLNKTVNISRIKLEGDKAKNYEVDVDASQQTTTANINRKKVTVVPANASKVYGEPDPNFEVEIPDLVYGDTVNYTLSRDSGEDAGTYAIKPQGTKYQGNYEVAFARSVFTINPRTVYVDGIYAEDKVYDGTTDATLESESAEIHGTVFGDLLSVTATGTFCDKNVDRDDGYVNYKDVDITDIRLVGAKAGNYVVDNDHSQKKAEARITPAPITVWGITAPDKTYDGTTAAGELDCSSAIVVTPFGNDDVSVASATGVFEDKNVTRDEGGNIIAQTVNVFDITLSGGDKDNYYVDPEEGTQATTEAKITPKEVVVSGLKAKNKPYDNTTDATFDVSEATIADVIADDKDEVVVESAEGHFADPSKGLHKLVEVDTITLGGSLSGNYAPKADQGPYYADITESEVIVTVDPGQSKVYGETEPTLTATVEPASAADDIEFELTREVGEDAGTYTITASGEASQGDGKYSVTFIDGTFEITSCPVTVTPDDKEKAYGEADPELTVTISPGLVGGDTLDYSVSRDQGDELGTYNIIAKGDELQGGASNKNYRVTYVNPGTFTITPKVVTVTAKSLSKVYGARDPELQATVTGLVGTDTITYEITRQPGQDAGTYVISPSGDTKQGNYNIKYVNGTFTIKQRNLTVTPNSFTKYYKEKDPTFTAKVTGAIKGETVSYTLKRERGEATGTYTITASGEAEQGNYKVTYKTGKLTITDREKLIPEYSAHVQGLGWTSAGNDGVFAGTTGQKRRMESITVMVPDAPYSGGITYCAHVQSKGWMGWVKDGAIAGTWGKGLRAEAFKMKLHGKMAEHFDVYYRVHVQGFGWMAWAKNGQVAGATGMGRRCEAIQIVILRKGSSAPSRNYQGVAQMYNSPSASK